MAGDWIKVEVNLHEKPEVIQMALELNTDELDVQGRLVRIWSWANQQSLSGHAINVTQVFIDRLAQRPGFADALRKVGWLEGRDGALTFPHFERHNGQTAKNRALAKDRQAVKRQKTVTQESRNERDNTVTREEKRREENKGEGTRPPPADSFAEIPSKEEVRSAGLSAGIPEAYCDDFWEYQESMNLWLNKYGRAIKWRGLLLTRWRQDEADWRAGTHRAQRKGRQDVKTEAKKREDLAHLYQ